MPSCSRRGRVWAAPRELNGHTEKCIDQKNQILCGFVIIYSAAKQAEAPTGTECRQEWYNKPCKSKENLTAKLIAVLDHKCLAFDVHCGSIVS